MQIYKSGISLFDPRVKQAILAEKIAKDGQLPDDIFPYSRVPRDGAATARQRLHFPSFFNTDGWLRQCDKADWQNVPPELRKFAGLLIQQLRKYGMPFYIHAAYRDKATQNSHYAKGTSKLQYPDAPHCRGYAIDVVHSVYHWDLTPQEWLLLSAIAKDVLRRLNADLPASKKLPIVWGGSWRPDKHTGVGWDPAHFEVANWRNLPYTLHEGTPVRITPKLLAAS